MITTITFRTIVSFFSRKNIKNKIEIVDQTVSELIHPRFAIKDTDTADGNKNNNNKSLLFHMYSKENDTLFI